MRIAFTIILNGLHHLKHNNYAEYLLKHFDYWVVVEGATNNGGSTNWCGKMPPKYHNNGASIDGTREYLNALSSNPKLKLTLSNRLWNSKDEQVNIAASTINSLTSNAFVWEIDADEQWDIKDIELSEQKLKEENAKTGFFYANYYVGKNLIVKGQWGEGMHTPYNRLWDWSNDTFQQHEPPTLTGGNGKMIFLPQQRFNHYAYYFEQDVQFKNDWYSGHDNILAKWKLLQHETHFPQPISRLIGGFWGGTATTIHRI